MAAHGRPQSPWHWCCLQLLRPDPPERNTHDIGFFPETGYGVWNPEVRAYFDSRGGVETFGYPISNVFTLYGFDVQLFQRQGIQIGPNGSPRGLNILQSPYLDYRRFGGLTIPALDTAPGRVGSTSRLTWLRPRRAVVRSRARPGRLARPGRRIPEGVPGRRAARYPSAPQGAGGAGDLGPAAQPPNARSGQRQLHLSSGSSGGSCTSRRRPAPPAGCYWATT